MIDYGENDYLHSKMSWVEKNRKINNRVGGMIIRDSRVNTNIVEKIWRETERETERDRETERERDKERQRDIETERDRESSISGTLRNSSLHDKLNFNLPINNICSSTV